MRDIRKDQNEAVYRIREILAKLGHATHFQDIPIDDSNIADGRIWAYDAATNTWVIIDLPAGSLGDHVHMDCGTAAYDLVDIDCGDYTDDVEIECGSIV